MNKQIAFRLLLIAIAALVLMACAGPPPTAAPAAPPVVVTAPPVVVTAPPIVQTVIVAGTPQVQVITPTAVPPPTKASAGSDTLVVSLDRVITGGMDATQTVESTGKTASFEISETLVDFDEATNTVKPKLAESWEAGSDGLTFTFHLRKGVKFQDGTDFNADAVVASLMRVYDPKNPLHDTGVYPTASYAPIKLVEKVDDSTVKITADHTDPIFMWRMSLEPTFIESPTAIQKYGKDYTNHAVGTGPFELVSFDPQTKVVLKRFDGYWGTKPSFTNLIFKVNPDNQSKVADLLAGNVDMITWPPSDQLDTLKSTAGIKVGTFPLRWLSYITLNATTAPFNDPVVRQAVNYAFDRATLANVLNKGTSIPSDTVWYKGAYAFEPNYTKYPFDPAKAKSLLDQDGWTVPSGGTVREKNGKPLQFRLIQAGTLYGPEEPIPELFQSNMKDIGMDAIITKVDPSVFFDPKVGASNPANQEAAVFGWIATVPDPALVFDRFTKRSFPPNGYNMGFYSNPKVEPLYQASLSELDLTKRAQYFTQIQDIVTQDAAILPLGVVTVPMAWSDRVDGFVAKGNQIIELAGVTIK